MATTSECDVAMELVDEYEEGEISDDESEIIVIDETSSSSVDYNTVNPPKCSKQVVSSKIPETLKNSKRNSVHNNAKKPRIDHNKRAHKKNVHKYPYIATTNDTFYETAKISKVQNKSKHKPELVFNHERSVTRKMSHKDQCVPVHKFPPLHGKTDNKIDMDSSFEELLNQYKHIQSYRRHLKYEVKQEKYITKQKHEDKSRHKKNKKLPVSKDIRKISKRIKSFPDHTVVKRCKERFNDKPEKLDNTEVSSENIVQSNKQYYETTFNDNVDHNVNTYQQHENTSKDDKVVSAKNTGNGSDNNAVCYENTFSDKDDDELNMLRLMALASRGNLSVKPSDQDLDDKNIEIKQEPDSTTAANSPSSNTDNHELVDMEISSDIEMVPEIKEECQNLFSFDSTDDDYEEELLRAELIASLNRKTYFQDEFVKPDLTTPDLATAECVLQTEIDKKTELPKECNEVEAPRKQVFLTTPKVSYDQLSVKDKKHQNFKLDRNSIKTMQPMLYMKQEPIIINLGNDSSSSSDESDEEAKIKKTALADLEKYIETAKNECYVGNDTIDKEAKGEQSQTTLENDRKDAENKFSKASLNEFKEKLKKFLLFSSTLAEETDILSMLKVRVNKSKTAYIASEVNMQRLSEQLLAAEKVKNQNKNIMFAANAEFRNVRSTITKHLNILDDLKRDCVRCGSAIFGKGFNFNQSSLSNLKILPYMEQVLKKGKNA